MMGLEVLGEKKKEGGSLPSERAAGSGLPEDGVQEELVQEESAVEPQAEEAGIVDATSGCDPATAEPPR